MNTIGATGQGLPPVQALYPATIPSVPGGLVATNRVTLPPGGDMIIPSGTWAIESAGGYAQLQILDPVTTTWVAYGGAFTPIAPSINSDGVNYRMINPLGFPAGAVVNASGTGYTSAPTVAASFGGSTWVALVGGAVSAINCNTASSGVGYAVPPIVNIAAPPSPGVPATAVANISGGSITSFTIVNPGAGYTSAPAVVITPQGSDLNFYPANPQTATTTTVNATATTLTSWAGQVTAVLMTNEGSQYLLSQQTSGVGVLIAPALSFTGGGGSGAAATAIIPQTIVNMVVSTAGSGYSGGVGVIAEGGNIAAQTSGNGVFTNSLYMSTNLVSIQPAQLSVTLSGSSIATVSAQNSGINFGGIYTAVPTLIPIGAQNLTAGTPTSTFAVGAVINANMGVANDTVFVTPL